LFGDIFNLIFRVSQATSQRKIYQVIFGWRKKKGKINNKILAQTQPKAAKELPDNQNIQHLKKHQKQQPKHQITIHPKPKILQDIRVTQNKTHVKNQYLFENKMGQNRQQNQQHIPHLKQQKQYAREQPQKQPTKPPRQPRQHPKKQIFQQKTKDQGQEHKKKKKN